jgi:hypothetical protein
LARLRRVYHQCDFRPNSIILLALLVTELQIKFGIDPADLIID